MRVIAARAAKSFMRGKSCWVGRCSSGERIISYEWTLYTQGLNTLLEMLVHLQVSPIRLTAMVLHSLYQMAGSP